MPKLSVRQWIYIAITFGIYTLIVGWKFAIVFVVAIGFHEYCHLMMAHKLGMKTGGFNMIPFIGGLAYINGNYKSLYDRALVLLAGPIGGNLLAAVSLVFYLITKVPFFGASAYWMFVLNLFNLLPLSFLDGGQLMDCVSYSLNKKWGFRLMVISNIIGLIVMVKLNLLIALMVLIFGGANIYLDYNNQKNEALGKTWLCSPAYLNKPASMSRKQIISVVLMWGATFLLIGCITTILYISPLSNYQLLTASR